MRIVSLVPAATEIVWALGATDQLVAVTHDDDFPEAVLALPRVTRSTIPASIRAREIDVHVREAGARGESTFHLDEQALRDARPDVILGQTLCAVCAVTLDRVPAKLEREPDVVPLGASSIDGMFEDIRSVGAALGRVGDADRLVDDLRAPPNDRDACRGTRAPARRVPRVARPAVQRRTLGAGAGAHRGRP